MSRVPIAYVFIDANTALHFMRPDQIDWCKLVDAKEVVLVAAPILLRELEHQKIMNSSRKLRERAAGYIKWLHPLVRQPETEVRSGVRWLFLPHEPQVDFVAERLSQTIADDHLIASVLQHTRNSSIHAFVATADLGLEVKLRGRGISVLALPDEQRLSAETDPLEQENRDLKQQLARIQARMPKLSVAFEDGTQHHALHLREPSAFTITPLEQVRADNPYMSRPGKATRHQGGVASPFADFQRLTQQFGVSAEGVDAHNEELERYFREYQDYLDRHAAWQDIVCLHHVIKFVVANDGTAPASNIDLDLFFPGGVVPVDEGDFPKKPKSPNAPIRPKGIMDIRGLGNSDYLSSLMSPNLHHMINPNNDGVPITSGDKDSVRIGYSGLKHGFSFTSDSLIIRFLAPESVMAFSIDYCLSADELPDTVEGQLHFRIESTDA